MEAALHRNDAFAPEIADDKVAFVSNRRGNGESGEFAVRYCYLVSYTVDHFAEPAAEDNSDYGFSSAEALGKSRCSVVDLFNECLHLS